jgi:hypothetical protein
MSLLNHEEDMQYFMERTKAAPQKKEICKNTIRLLEQAEKIYVPKKQKVY